MSNNFSRGSEWRKWDLHLHTPSSFDYKNNSVTNDDIVNKLVENGIKLAVITDHHYIDVNRFFELKDIAQNKVVFLPGIELRTELGGSESVHITVIFPDFTEKSKLERLWDKLNVKLKIADQIEKNGNASVYVNFENASEIIKQLNGLISIHSGHKSNSIENITNALSYKQAIKTDIANNVDFYEIGNENDIIGYESKVFPAIDKIIPLVRGSDNHNVLEYQLKFNCWIKADLTFEGLKQVIIQPKERVYIGDIPPRLKQIENKPNQFIDTIKIDKVTTPKHKKEKWFDSANTIPLNSGMVAIIGGKGSGKSALSDIIGHFCYCKTMNKASFLNDNRFRKAPKKYAEDYQGYILWKNGQKDNSINLLQKEYPSSIERAQYLPQKYIEDVCNNLDNEFQEEIDNVIFSYIDDNKKMGQNSLRDLINAKNSEISIKHAQLKEDIINFSKRLIILQDKNTKNYKISVNDHIKMLEEELKNHIKTKPKFVSRPNEVQDEKLVKRLDFLNSQIKKREKYLKILNDEYSKIMIHLEQIKNFKNEIYRLEKNASVIVDTINNYLVENNLIKKSKISLNIKINLKDLDDIQNKLECKLNKLEILCSDDNSNTFSYSYRLGQLNLEKNNIIKNTNAEQQIYQNFLLKYKEWKEKTLFIIGSKEQKDSLRFYKNEKYYIENSLEKDLRNAKRERKEFISNAYKLLDEKSKIYEEIYKPVKEKLSKILGKIDNEIQFTIDKTYKNTNLEGYILDYIDQKMTSRFRGKTEGLAYVSSLRKEIDLLKVSSIQTFINCIIEEIETSAEPRKLVYDRLSLYEYLLSLEFLDISFALKMSDRNITELSAGEKGLLLLVFYLALSKESKPLIIDQPEDNLDNQSVYSKLVPCIQEAKINRQLIIVTHNPNIAVACDAEQIIYCTINKKNNNEIKYISGSIENPTMKKNIVDILEGTEPAFYLRKQKYNI